MSLEVSGYAALTKSFTFGTKAAVGRIHHDHVVAAGQHLEQLQAARGVLGEQSLGRIAASLRGRSLDELSSSSC